MGLAAAADAPWALPVYCCDDFQSPGLFPLFFSEADLEEGWARSGKPADEAMFLVHTVMDLRAYVANMLSNGAMPWETFQLVTSGKAYALAKELGEAAAAREGEEGG